MKIALSFLSLWFLASGCGQDPSFVDASLTDAGVSSGSTADAQAQFSNEATEAEPDNGSTTPPSGADDIGSMIASVTAGISTPAAPSILTSPVTATPLPAPASTPAPALPAIVPTFPSDPVNPYSPTFSVPGLTPSEQVQVAQCITKWGRVPFGGTFTNVRRIKAAVSVFGVGLVINDTLQTQTPALILVDAGVNVMGSPIYNLLNNNGYYCMKVNVNVKTNFNINLACNAKLADNSVQVNVGSQVNSDTSVIGVNVGSSVQVNRMTASHGQCQY